MGDAQTTLRTTATTSDRHLKMHSMRDSTSQSKPKGLAPALGQIFIKISEFEPASGEQAQGWSAYIVPYELLQDQLEILGACRPLSELWEQLSENYPKKYPYIYTDNMRDLLI